MDPLDPDRHIIMNVNDYCRFCSEPVRIAGAIHHSKNIFEKKTKDQDTTIFEQLRGLGLTLAKRRDMSFRSCVKCDTKVKRLVIVLPDFRRWEQAERVPVSSDPAPCSHGSDPVLSSGPASPPSPTPSSYSSSSDKSSRVVTPTKTPRTLKKLRPTSPDRHATPTAKRSITAVVMKLTERRDMSFRHVSDPVLSSGPPSPSPTPSSYDSSSDKRSRVVTPTKTPRTLTKLRPTSPDHALPTAKRSITEVVMKFPSKTVTKISQPEEAGIVTNVTTQKWKTAAKQILKHKELAVEVKEQILHLIDIECKALCKHDNGCMLLKTAAADLESFSFEHLESDLRRLSPFLLSILSTVTNGSQPVTCAAAAIAVRGRENRMSAFAYHINGILQHGGGKKAVFESLSKMAITTSFSCAIWKQKELAKSYTCGETADAVQALQLHLEEHQREHGSDVEMSLITQFKSEDN